MMTKTLEAVKFVDNIVQNMAGSRADHVKLQLAVALIQKTLEACTCQADEAEPVVNIDKEDDNG